MKVRSNTMAWRLAAGASLAAICIATPALAQDANANQNTAGGDIVVTAQFREQKLQDTPIAITAVDAATLEAKSQTDLVAVADAAPNVQIKPQTSAFGPSVSASIRGVGQNDFNPAYEPGVAIYIDDVYYPQLTGAVFDLLDLDRVEILRGPQGTLTGRNSEGGAIKMYSRRPDGTDTGYAEATYGSSNRLGVRAAAEFTVANNLYARFSGVFKRQEGYIDNLDFGCAFPAGGSATFKNAAGQTVPVNPAGGVAAIIPASAKSCVVDKLGGVGYQAVRGTLRYNPNDAIDIQLTGDYVHDEHTIAGDVLLSVPTNNNPNTNPAPGVPYDSRFICGPYCNFASTGQPAALFNDFLGVNIPGAANAPLVQTQGSNQSVYDGWGVSLRGEFNLTDNLTLTSISGYRKFEALFDGDDDVSPANLGYGQNDLTNWSFSQELRLGAKLGETLFATLGGFYFKQDSTYDSFQDIRYIPVFPLQFTQPDNIKADAKAVFGHLSWEPVENMTISGGLRYTDESKDYTYYRFQPNGVVNPFQDLVGFLYGVGYRGADTLDSDGDGNRTETVTALSGTVNHYAANRWDWRVSADYRLSDQVMVYANVATGFKGGGTNPRPFTAAQALISFQPEELTAYEAGIKTDLFDRQLRLNVSAFYNDFKSLQVPVLSCPDSPCAARLNGADAEVKGVEVEAALTVLDGLSIDGSLSYLDFQFSKIVDPLAGYPANPGGIAIGDPGGSPKWKWSLGAQYEIDMGSNGTLTPRIDAYYQADQFTGAVVVGSTRSYTYIPNYTIANARLTYRSPDRDWELAAEVTNLFDKYYYNSVFDLSGIGISKRANPARPREWALTVKRKF